MSRINLLNTHSLKSYVLLGVVLFAGTISAHAQASSSRHEQASEQGQFTAAESRENASRIGADDLLEITVFEASEMNRTVRVSTSGEFSFPMLGPVRADGLTPTQLESVLEELLRKSYLRDPHVGVFVRELQSHPVSVVGAVKAPGVFQIQGAKPLLQVLSMAQGLSDDAGDTVLITRDRELPESGVLVARAAVESALNDQGVLQEEERAATEMINLRNLMGTSDPGLNVLVRPGDIVKVTYARIVYVVGEVHKPGGFVLKNGKQLSVLQALALAEGLTRTSSKSQARIIRTDAVTGVRAEIPVNLGKVLSGKLPDPILQPDDIVFVPNSLAKGALFRGSEAALVTATGVAIYRW